MKRDEICYFHDYEWFPNWENFLTSDYWKDWRNKIPLFQSEEELIFYFRRLNQIAELIWRSKKYGVKEGENADLLIKKEEVRLQNISQEDWKKEYKTLNVEFKELSAKEMLNDPWFSKQLGFGSENKKDEERKGKESSPIIENDNTDYKSWTQEQLTAEVNRLKAENEELKSNQILTASEKESRIRQNQQRLEQIQDIYESQSPTQQPVNNNFPTSLIIGAALLAVIGLISYLVIKSKSVNKKAKSYGK